MKTKLIIKPEHLDKALSLPWSTQTCLVAQAVMELTGKPVIVCSGGGAIVGKEEVEELRVDCLNALKLAFRFDAGYGSAGVRNQQALNELRAMLPLEVDAEVYPKGSQD